MKSRSLLFLPRTLVVCVAPLLACATAQATVFTTNETQNPNVWTLPSGTNILAGATITTSAPLGNHGEGTGTNPAILTDGTVGDTAGTDHGTSVSPANGTSMTFALDLSSHPAGYNVTSFDSYCAWDNSGRDNQNFMIQYSTVANPGTFITLSMVSVQSSIDRSTHTRLTDTAGFLAQGVASIRLIFDRQENNYVGYREFILQDTPSVINVGNARRSDNNWPALVGPNLLNGATATPSTANTHEGSNASWATLTDGALGTPDTNGNAQSVTPNNGDVVVFPLDLVAKPTGYDITSFESFCAWGSSGRDDQRYTLEYATVAAPTTYVPITEVNNHTEWAGNFDSGYKSTRTRITANGGTPMALGVASIRVTFHDQENTYTGFREFVLRDTPLPTTLVNESNATNIWTLPTGTNLLANGLEKDPALASGSSHGNNDNTNSDWNTLTDGTVGSAGNQMESVGPLNATSVVFPLDISTNTKGYDLKSLDSYGAWGDSGRDDQDYTVSYSTAEDPSTFISIGTVSNKTFAPINSTHTRIAATAGNILGTHVGAVKFEFNNQENGWTGFREFVALGTPVPLVDPLTWAGGTNANWTATDNNNNWKQNGVSAPFTSAAGLIFNNTGINTTINVGFGITAASMTFSNDASHPYSFTGTQTLTVTNGISATGAGSVTFGNILAANALDVSGTGSVTLNNSNPLTGSTTVSNGTLNVLSDLGLGDGSTGPGSSLTVSGGTVRFSSQNPILSTLAGTGGTVLLGKSTGTVSSTLSLGIGTSSTYSGAIANGSASVQGSLYKTGGGTLTLAGTNTYTGTTTVSEGELKLGKRLSLYNGIAASWIPGKIIVGDPSGGIRTVLSLRLGGAGEFTSADVAALHGAFGPDAILGLDTSSGNAEISNIITGSVKIEKEGINTLRLSAANTFSSGITIDQGALEFAKTGGAAITSDLTVGNITFDSYANMAADNQFGPNSLLKFNTGAGAVNGKFQLRGTSQTVAGIDSTSNDRIACIQNDDVVAPGYTTDPGPATLTINTAAVDSFHSYHGILRNNNGGSVSVIKTGLGTQEFVNSLDGFTYDGLTTINQGKLRLNFVSGSTGFGSNVVVNSPGTFDINATGGDYNFDRIISGNGPITATGINAIRLTNPANAFTGGLTIGSPEIASYFGFLALSAQSGVVQGAGNAAGQTCIGGAMTPTNVITVQGGATLALDGISPLGESSVQPAYAPSVVINNSGLRGSGLAFVANLTLNHGEVTIGNGMAIAGFDTALCFVGTVTVAGDSNLASTVITPTAGPTANASLGSPGLPGTVFNVSDVTSSADVDLDVQAVLRNANSTVAPLTKTGAGTMFLEGANTYTGDTTITGGVLTVNGSSIVDTNKVIINGGKLGVTDGMNETIGSLYFGSVKQAAGTYGSTTSTATHKDDTHFSGTGIVTVSPDVVAGYEQWASVITNGQNARGQDADGDGFTNLQEYLFGTSPIVANGSLSTLEKSGNNLIIRWSQRVPGTYTLKESTTLMNPWTTSAIVPTNAADQTGQYSPDYTRKEAVIPVDSVRKFVRVEATE
jgi:autotransporter-associated beta strand protein